jgi:acyl dehydratase
MPGRDDTAGATVVDLADLGALVGQHVATSGWLEVTQDRIDAFAEATDDRQWIHVDPERARAETPFGAAIAHGFLTLSLLSAMLGAALTVTGTRMALNYGLNRVRFVSPVPAGSRIRARIALGGIEQRGDSLNATWSVTVEREGGEGGSSAARSRSSCSSRPCRRGSTTTS